MAAPPIITVQPLSAVVMTGKTASLTNGITWQSMANNAAGSWGNANNIREVNTTNLVAVRVTDSLPASTNTFLRIRVSRP